ncbi:HpcH/HpaI aldolase family protein [Halorarum halobium]|uniref:HpcH/HpaI aldolase family protein n=1 Tax=Halorarum halobium TaxID=3075121 RepID=UPI0028AE41AB|nr:aldolase/citrate lyase family protein [Halobaculum sp. XH14]
MDQTNSFRTKLEEGTVVLGASADTFAPSLVELYGELGLDFVWLDYEHHGATPWDSHALENLSRAAELVDTELLVRIPEPNPALVRKVLDTGVRNVLVPRIDTAAEVRRCVEAARYTYEDGPGERGNSTARTNTWRNTDRYLQTEDEQVCVGVMIEKASAIDTLDEILSVPELGFTFVGPSDLSVQMGFEKDDPEFQRRIAEVRSRSLDAGVPVGCIEGDPDAAARAIEDGYQIVRIASEFGAVQRAVRDRLRRIQ